MTEDAGKTFNIDVEQEAKELVMVLMMKNKGKTISRDEWTAFFGSIF